MSDTYEPKTIIEWVGYLGCMGVFIPVFMGIHLLMDGWALSWLWQWFVAEPFNQPVLSIGHATMLAFLVAFGVRRGPDLKDTPDVDGWSLFKKISLWLFFSPVLAVATGWVVKTWFMAPPIG